MRMTAPFFFMEDNCTGMAGGAVLAFNPVDGVFKRLYCNFSILRRIERNGKEELLAFGAAADRKASFSAPVSLSETNPRKLMHADVLASVGA